MSTELNLGSGGKIIATEPIGGEEYEIVKAAFGTTGNVTKVSAADPMPVTDANTATSAKQDTGNTSLGSIDTKLSSQATAANQATEISALASILAKLSADPATQTTLAAVLAKITSDPATQTTLAAILAKIIAAPATEAKQDTGNISLASIDGKLTNPLPVSGTVTTGGLTDTQLRATPVPVTGTITAVTAISNALPAGNNNIGDVDIASIAAGNNNIGDVDIASIASGDNNIGNVDIVTLPALVAGSAIIGKVGIDQTTPGTTNGVQVNAALPAGTNAIGKLAANSGVIIGAVEIAAAQTLAALTAITNNVNTVEVAPTTVLNGKKTVTTAGSRVTLAGSTACKSVTIKALKTNTGIIYVGDSSVASTTGFQLYAGESVSMDIANLTTVNLDSSANGEGVTYLAVN